MILLFFYYPLWRAELSSELKIWNRSLKSKYRFFSVLRSALTMTYLWNTIKRMWMQIDGIYRAVCYDMLPVYGFHLWCFINIFCEILDSLTIMAKFPWLSMEPGSHCFAFWGTCWLFFSLSLHCRVLVMMVVLVKPFNANAAHMQVKKRYFAVVLKLTSWKS